MHDVGPISKNLHFHMPALGVKAFEKHTRIVEQRLATTLDLLKGSRNLLHRLADLQPHPAPSTRRLEHDLRAASAPQAR